MSRAPVQVVMVSDAARVLDAVHPEVALELTLRLVLRSDTVVVCRGERNVLSVVVVDEGLWWERLGPREGRDVVEFMTGLWGVEAIDGRMCRCEVWAFAGQGVL